jgi:methionyl aminopeptidase
MITLKTTEELAIMREANRIVAETLEEMKEKVRPGMTTADLEAIAQEKLIKTGAKPAFLGYPGPNGPYPSVLCASVNEEVIHGIPSRKKVLREGDIVSLDFGVIWKGYYGDAALTAPVGKISQEAQRLLDGTRESLMAGIKQAREGNRISDISAAVQKVAESRGFSVVKQFVGHGIGRNMHEEPQVPNFVENLGGRRPRLKAGMVLAIEPMVNAGTWAVRVLDDGWTAVTEDGSLSAHFEHSVAITQNGPEPLSVL